MTLVGGDQLTVARIRGAQKIRGNSEKSEDRFDGLLPVAEDWHTKMCFMEVREGIYYATTQLMVIQVPNILQVIWKRLYKTKSGMERGTLYQLRNLINRRNVIKKVKSDMNACEDFLSLLLVI